MISVTVRTLDAGNHQFSVEDHLTVEEFKKHIENVVNVPADRQRIIYCGRVLQNNYKLTDCDVDGKVVHLVQRAPPSANANVPPNSSTSTPTTNSSNNTQSRRGRFGFRGFDPINNAVYMGSMSIPQAVMNAQQLVPARATYTLSSSRLNVAKKMLRNAEALIRTLEQPSSENSESSPTEESTEEDVTPVIEARVFVPSDGGQPIDENAIVNAVENSLFSSELGGADDEDGNNESAASRNGEPANTTTGNENSSSESSTGASGRSNNRSSIRCRGTEMADLITRMNELQIRFSPFLTRYQNFMRDDPSVSQEELPGVTDLLNKVSQILHLLGHAYHSLSDVIINADHPPPRSLLCRPILIQQSAVVQTGIPIQVEAQINLSTGRTTIATTATTTSSATTAGSAATSSSATTDSNAAANSTARTNTTSENTAVPPTANTTTSSNSTLPTSGVSVSSAPEAPIVFRADSHILDGVPGVDASLVDVLFERIIPNYQSTNWAGGITAVSTAGSTVVSTSTPISTTQTTTNTPNQRNVPMSQGLPMQPGQTRPTTARRLIRPHMHMSQQTVQSGFDPFLPCYSHHISSSNHPTSGHPTNHIEAILPRNWANSVQTSASTQTNRSNPSQRNEAGTFEAPDSPIINDNDAAQIIAFAVTQAMRLAQRQVTSQFGSDPQMPSLIPTPSPTQISTPTSTLPTTVTMPTVAATAGHPTTPTRMPEHHTGTRRLAHTNQTFISELLDALNEDELRETEDESADEDPMADETTVAELMQNPTFEPGENVLPAFFLSMCGPFRLRDLLQLARGNPDPLSNTFTTMQEFIRNGICQQDTSESGIANGIETIMNDIRLFMDAVRRIPVYDDIDINATMQEFLRAKLQSLIELVLNEQNPEEGAKHFLSAANSYIKELFALIIRCSKQGKKTMETLWHDVLDSVLNAVANVKTLSPFVRTQICFFRNHRKELIDTVLSAFCTGPTLDVSKYIIKKRTPVQAMEVDDYTPPMGIGPLGVITDTNPLPQVVYGSERWHRDIPEEWIPMITRDIQKQRNQGSQPPASDAYLSGMPNKRRKLINNQDSLSQIISDTVRQALDVTNSENAEVVSHEAGQSTEIRTAYRTLLQSAVETRLNDNEDFTAEKYPNIAKCFDRKPQ